MPLRAGPRRPRFKASWREIVRGALNVAVLFACAATSLAQPDPGSEDDSGDDPDTPPPVVGELTVRFTGSGEGTRKLMLEGIESTERFQASVQAEGRYAVILNADGYLEVDERLSSSAGATVSGAGVYRIPDIDLNHSWTYFLPPDFDTKQDWIRPGGRRDRYSTFGGSVPVDCTCQCPTGSEPCDAGHTFLPGLVGGAIEDLAEMVFTTPSNLMDWSYTKTASTNIQWTGDLVLNATITDTVTLTLSVNRPRLQAILEPDPEPGMKPYESWLPEGSRNEDEPGNSLRVKAYLADASGAPVDHTKARFTFYLNDVSRQPGVCLNYPPKDKALLTPDLRFAANDSLIPMDGGLTIVTAQNAASAEATIDAYDWGASGSLKVVVETETGQSLVAHLKGKPDQTLLRIPQDENSNQIADAWERAEGTYGTHEEPDWDESWQPDYHRAKGDGISLYEKYRGFHFLGAHERLKPSRKYVFVRDRDGWAQLADAEPEAVTFHRASECEVRYIGEQEWTGAGSASQGRRVVNFNSSKETHAIDQHALHLVFNYSEDPYVPGIYQEAYAAKYGPDDPPLSGPWGSAATSWPDAAFHGAGSPVQWLMCVLYTKTIAAECRRFVRRHTLGLWPGYDALSEPEKEIIRPQADAKTAEFIRLNPQAWADQNWRWIKIIIAHELAHGVGVLDLQENKGGPHTKACIMRYFYLDDYPRDPNDRFEFARRTWPTRICNTSVATETGTSCRSRIKITDRPTAGPSQVSPSPIDASKRAALAGARPLATSSDALFESQVVAPAAPLQLSGQLPWDDLLMGDPLRIELRLECAEYRQRLASLALSATNVTIGAAPAIPANWAEHLELGLFRVESNGDRMPVLGAGTWSTFLRPLSEDLAAPALPPVTSAREWLVPSNRLKLQAGRYVLTAVWNGRNLVSPALLPASGQLQASDVSFEVSAGTNEIQRARHEERLAYEDYLAGLYDSARTHGENALAAGAQNAAFGSIGAALLTANAAVKLRQYNQAARLLVSTLALSPPNEATRMAQTSLQTLAPELSVKAAPTPGAGTTLALTVLPGQTYRTEVSTDLVRWESLDTRLTNTNRFEVVDAHSPDGAQSRFYRVAWLP